MASSPAGAETTARPASARAGFGWWPLAAILLLAAALRLGTLGLQSLWYDEAFTPVHVLHPSLWATLRSVVHTENSPPLWYVLEWGFTRVLGDGAVALRLLSALAGIATVAVVWAVGRSLAGRRAGVAAGAFAAVNPLFVWYSQEARVYALFVLSAAVAMLCFVRALEEPTPGRIGWFALSACVALVTHYFAVFLLAPMVVWLALAAGRERMRASAPLAAPILTGGALLPLVLAQGGHGTQWIGRWALSQRLQAIPQYYLTGYSGAPLGHGIELLIALVALAGVVWGLWRVLAPSEERAALIALVLTACGVLAPVALALLGADYLAPRNLVAAMAPLTVLLAVVIAARRAGAAGLALAGALCLAWLAVTLDVDRSARLQRGDWAGVARVLGPSGSERAVTTVELGGAPLLYYMPHLRLLSRSQYVSVREIDETGYPPLRSWAGKRAPAPGFRLAGHRNVKGLVVYRFLSRLPVRISGAALRRQTITRARPEVLANGAEKSS